MHAIGFDTVADGFEDIRVVLLCLVFDLTVLSQSTNLRSMTSTQLKTLIDGHNGRQITGEDLSDENKNRVGNTARCSCNRCSVMPSVAECLCCQKMDELG